jgi:hypothetical protein
MGGVARPRAQPTQREVARDPGQPEWQLLRRSETVGMKPGREQGFLCDIFCGGRISSEPGAERDDP